METTKEMHLWMINPEEYIHGGKPCFYLTDYTGMEQQGWFKISSPKVTIDFDMPTQEFVRTGTVLSLNEAIREVDAKAHAAKTMLQQKINDLLMIGYDSVEDHV